MVIHLPLPPAPPPRPQVEDLRSQLEQMENVTTGKNQDLEDTMEACQSRVSGGRGEGVCVCVSQLLL